MLSYNCVNLSGDTLVHKAIAFVSLLFNLGSTKHSITVTGQDGSEATVKDLLDALAQATGVPAPSQKIIFKGRL